MDGGARGYLCSCRNCRARDAIRTTKHQISLARIYTCCHPNKALSHELRQTSGSLITGSLITGNEPGSSKNHALKQSCITGSCLIRLVPGRAACLAMYNLRGRRMRTGDQNLLEDCRPSTCNGRTTPGRGHTGWPTGDSVLLMRHEEQRRAGDAVPRSLNVLQDRTPCLLLPYGTVGEAEGVDNWRSCLEEAHAQLGRGLISFSTSAFLPLARENRYFPLSKGWYCGKKLAVQYIPSIHTVKTLDGQKITNKETPSGPPHFFLPRLRLGLTSTNSRTF